MRFDQRAGDIDVHHSGHRAPGLDKSIPSGEPDFPDGLVIAGDDLDRVIAHLRAALPNEGVGLLATSVERVGGLPRVTGFVPGTNLDASPTRYTMDPREVIDALSEFERHGWRLGAIVHAHPATPPVPSPIDRHEAYYPMALAMIVSFATPVPAIGLWRMDDPAGPIAGRLVIEGHESRDTVEATRGNESRPWAGEGKA